MRLLDSLFAEPKFHAYHPEMEARCSSLHNLPLKPVTRFLLVSESHNLGTTVASGGRKPIRVQSTLLDSFQISATLEKGSQLGLLQAAFRVAVEAYS